MALEQVLMAHAAYVAHARGGVRAQLTLCDMEGAGLSHRILSGADLSGSRLRGADLNYAEFVGAVLYCADLSRIKGRYADFCHADLRGATLNGSDLSGAKLDFADFRPGRLVTGTDEVINQTSSAANVDFSNASLCGASFEGAHLQYANFSGAIIHATRFKNACLTKAVFEGAVLSQIQMDELKLPPSVLKTCLLVPPINEANASRHRIMDVLEAHQHWIDSDGRAGEPARLDGEDLRTIGSAIRKYRLSAVSARRAIGVAVNFAGLQLQGVNFEEADLRGADFEGADLRGVKFRGARLFHANFKNADLRPLHLRSGERLDVDVFRAEITEEQLAEARHK